MAKAITLAGPVSLGLLTVFFYLCLVKILNKNRIKFKDSYEQSQRRYQGLTRELANLKEENLNLENTAEEITALYNITKDICKSLDMDTVFHNFMEQINRYVRIGDCKFIKYGTDTYAYKDYTILPLEIERARIGFLALNKIEGQDKEKFYVLSQQFLLGIKRAFLYQKVQGLAITDSLTGVLSRRYLLERLAEELERSKKFGYTFSFLMVDIDNFKHYNDHYGHLVGDAVLKESAAIIRQNLRQIDLVGRYGGEEFSVILTETDKTQAEVVAESIRKTKTDKKN